MQAEHYLPEHLSTELLLKCSKTQSEIFNRKVLTQYSTSDELEREYVLKDQSLMRSDSRYEVFGPIGCCGFLQDEYEKVFSQKRWEAITSILPQGNLTLTTNNGIRRCFECQSETNIRSAYPILGRNGRGQRRGSGRDAGRGERFTRMSAWRYIAPETDNAKKR